MKHFIICLALSLLIVGCGGEAPVEDTNKEVVTEEPKGENNMAYRWATIVLKATGNDTERFRPRPTVTSRYLALIFTSIFDAWSMYDDKATPVYLQGVERQADSARTLKNKEIAISYAAFGTLNEYFFSDSVMFVDFMNELGYDPNDVSTDPNTPAGIGNLAAQAVIEARKGDGANQYGEDEGSDGQAYFNYVNYQPINSPDKNKDQNRWQPKYFADGKGGKWAPTCLTPFWPNVKPIALDSANQFRPGPPPMIGSDQLKQEVKDVIDMQANLTLEEKGLVEFMRDGPKSVQQAGHWLMFAQHVSKRDGHTLDEDVKMYFLNQVAAMDAFIAAWETKMYYDFARPFALVHYYYKDSTIKGWGGPGKGTVEMKGSQWVPYSPETFVCPPFPSYVSGHSCVSGACSKVLELYKGNDEFDHHVKLVPGSMTEPEINQDTIEYIFTTFSQTAERAGLSRVLGGYHIQADNIEGLNLGRNVAQRVYEFYLEHIGEEKPQ